MKSASILKQAANLQLRTNIDANWYKNNKTPELEEFVTYKNSGKRIRTDDIVIEDRDSGEAIVIAELPNYVPVLDVEDISGTHIWTKNFSNGYIIYPDGLELKLVNLEVIYEIHQLEQSIVIGGEDTAHILVQDALAGTLLPRLLGVGGIS